jgi:hypothetical protein
MTSTDPTRSRVAHVLSAISSGAAITTVGIGCVVLAGWFFDVEVLKSLDPAAVSMKANTAVAFVLGGISLWLSQSKRIDIQAARYAAWASASVVAALGLFTLGEYAFGWDPGIDQLLFKEPAGTVLTIQPGRMAPNTALISCCSAFHCCCWTRGRAGVARSNI